MEGFWVIYAGVFGVALVWCIYYVSRAIQGTKRVNFAKRVVKMQESGELKGKTLSELTEVLGDPSGMSSVSGCTTAEWSAGGYMVSLMFDDEGKCLGVLSEDYIKI